MARKKKVNLKELYSKLPREVRVFVEYVLPSAVLTALVDYLADLKVENTYVMGGINLTLIFLRNLKPRIQSLRG